MNKKNNTNNEKPYFDSYDKAVSFVFRHKHSRKSKWPEMRTERMKYFLKQLGSPEEKLKVVHITGTAGKGSTSAMIARILQESGYKVGLITSPHLQTVRERILINNEKISEDNFLALSNRVKKAFDTVVERGSYGKPDYQQIHIAGALWWFIKQKVDIAVVEVGMGGYGDATNCVQPLVSIITNVGIDHTQSLGDTVEKVARVKSGIIKKGAIAITGARQPKVEEIIQKRSNHVGAKLIRVKESAEFNIRKVTPEFVIADIKTRYYNLQKVYIKLTGRFQVRNATIAVLTASVLRRKFGFKKVNDETIRRGLGIASIPGRFEIVNKEPLIILDSAHNEDKIKALAGLLTKLFDLGKLRFMMGFKEGKDYLVCLENIAKLKPKKLYLTAFTQRGIESTEIKKLRPAAEKLFADIEFFDSEKKCLKKAMEETKEGEALIVTGSMYLVGSIRHKWDKMK